MEMALEMAMEMEMGMAMPMDFFHDHLVFEGVKEGISFLIISFLRKRNRKFGNNGAISEKMP